MTRFEYAIEKLGLPMRKKFVWQEILVNYCPVDLDCGPGFDVKTAMLGTSTLGLATFGDRGHIIGCRGKSCGECWAEEVEDGLGI